MNQNNVIGVSVTAASAREGLERIERLEEAASARRGLHPVEAGVRR